jgi:tRNA dimethylallyltransferase
MMARNQTPLLVGGTNYYMQSLLWNESLISIDSMDTIGLDNKSYGQAHEKVEIPIAAKLKDILINTDPRFHDAPAIQDFCEKSNLHDLLATVDPTMSKKWHPSDYRKIRRSLEIYYTTGKTQSEWYSSQEKGKLRFPIIMIWLYGSPEVLDQRLDDRVDEMIKRGLIEEIKEMRQLMRDDRVVGGEKYLANGGGYTRGILQAIGFKEFHDYFEAMENSSIPKSELDRLFKIGVDDMKLATRQYARKQINWIKNKLGPLMVVEHEKQNAAFYVVDATGNYHLTKILLQSRTI